MIDLRSEVNTIYLIFVKQLGFSIKPIDIEVQKINDNTLNTYGIVVAAFWVTNKANQVKFCEKTFLIVNVSLEVILEIYFLSLSSANIEFLDRELW